MPVALRKRSWEEHVTHSSGSQYSYDDLDLICCRHAAAAESFWVGAEALKQGRRTRCASMPEGRRQLPASELPTGELPQATALATNDRTAPKEPRLMKGSVKVPQNLEEESVCAPLDSLEVDVFRGYSKEDHLQAQNFSNVANVFCNDARGNDILKSRHIAGEEPQCATILSNNGLPLSTLVADRPGDCPDDQEGTKESHVVGHSGPAQTSDCSSNRSSAATPQPNADRLHVEGEEEISASIRMEDPCLTSPAATDACGEMLRSREAALPLEAPEREKLGCRESCTSDYAERLDGVNGQDSENGRLDSGEGGQDHLGEQNDVTAPAESSKDAADVGCRPIASLDECFKGQCCSLTVKAADSADVEANHIKSHVSHCADQRLATTASPLGEGGDDELSAPQILGQPPSDQTAAEQLENSSIKLDTIPEVSHMQPDDVPVPDPPESCSRTPDPDTQHVHVDDKRGAESARHSADVCPPPPLQGLHSNDEEAARCLGESPGSEVADGQREHGRAAAASSPAMETESAQSDPGEQREGSGVRVRLRKVRLQVNQLVAGDVASVVPPFIYLSGIQYWYQHLIPILALLFNR